MRIAYVNIDEVNYYLVSRVAAEFSAVVCPLVAAGASLDLDFEAVLCNLDEVPSDRRCSFLEKLVDGASRRLTLVHGYGTTNEQGQVLIQNGVVAVRCLTIDLLRLLFVEVLKHRTVKQEIAIIPGGIGEPNCSPHRFRTGPQHGAPSVRTRREYHDSR
jgi:hypothetical protein